MFDRILNSSLSNLQKCQRHDIAIIFSMIINPLSTRRTHSKNSSATADELFECV